MVVASSAVAVALVAGWGWWRARRGGEGLEALSPEGRQELLDEALHENPGAFEPAWFYPPLGYTLRPGRRISAWDDTFTANRLGFRSGPPRKRPGTFRVVFVGDSWTFGMGIREQQSFPRQFEALAAQLGAGSGHRVEAWSLALPGYNAFNEMAALELFFSRLAPDLVVLCPCSNDADSSAVVLPNGSLARSQAEGDEFGDDHSLVFRQLLVDSFQFRRRWGICFQRMRQEELRLAARGVPLFIFFTATWDETWVHRMVGEAGIEAPYVVTPQPLTVGPWRNPPPFFHGTPAANALYGRMVYKGVAEMEGWPPPPPPAEAAQEVEVHHGPPPGDWVAQSERRLAGRTAHAIPERYLPGPDAAPQCIGPMDCTSGLMGRATTVLVRRRPGARRLIVSLRRLRKVPRYYPLAVELWVPSAGGGVRRAVTLSAEGPETQSFELEMPPDVPAGAALDVGVRAERVTVAPDVLATRSLYVAAIDQQ